MIRAKIRIDRPAVLQCPRQQNPGGETRNMNELDQLSTNALRFLAVDAVEKANSGHPGAPLGDAPIA
jgi:hypothetical protein